MDAPGCKPEPLSSNRARGTPSRGSEGSRFRQILSLWGPALVITKSQPRHQFAARSLRINWLQFAYHGIFVICQQAQNNRTPCSASQSMSQKNSTISAAAKTPKPIRQRKNTSPLAIMPPVPPAPTLEPLSQTGRAPVLPRSGPPLSRA